MNPQDQQTQFRVWLQTEFTRRCRVNSRYSVRAFAKQLDINQSTLTQILNGKRKISKKFIDKVAEKVGSTFHFQTNGQADLDFKYSVLSVDAFTVISDWYHYAILEFTAVKGFKSDAKWISKKLGITVSETNMAIDRLLRLNMITQKNGKLIRTKQHIANYKEGVTSGAHKEFQRQLLTKALQAIDNCPQDKKDITSITMPANSKKIKEVKDKIRQFRREICDYIEDGNHDSVYQLCVQLFPLTIED